MTGVNWPDALSAGPAAAKVGGPILPVQTSAIPSAISDELSRLQPQRAWVIGGPGVVSDAVQAQLSARRVAGTDRFSTAAAIARDAFPSATVGYLATGHNFPDALAGAPAAARDGAPLLLAAKDCVTATTRDAFTALGISSRVALGGDTVVSDRAAHLTSC